VISSWASDMIRSISALQLGAEFARFFFQLI
jgi:hypothetical protein